MVEVVVVVVVSTPVDIASLSLLAVMVAMMVELLGAVKVVGEEEVVVVANEAAPSFGVKASSSSAMGIAENSGLVSVSSVLVSVKSW
jgi:hypothetical protein